MKERGLLNRHLSQWARRFYGRKMALRSRYSTQRLALILKAGTVGLGNSKLTRFRNSPNKSASTLRLWRLRWMLTTDKPTTASTIPASWMAEGRTT